MKSFLWFCYQCFAVYTLLVYALVYWTPMKGWVAGFMMMSFPIVLLVQIFSVLAWLVVDKKRAVVPFVLVLLAGVFLPRTYAFAKEKEPEQAGSFRVMSYNAHSFMLNLIHTDERIKTEVGQMKTWIRDAGADVICMAEYYDDVTKVFNVNQVLTKGGYRYARFFKEERESDPHKYLGMALYSKYPIVASKDTVFMAQNGMIRADVKIGRDTVRVIALHLYSMTLNLGELARQKKANGVAREGKITLRKMRTGFVERAMQLEALKRWIHETNHPAIVCGDFNEVPYGYVYGELRKEMRNAFEDKGEGFGFTFNQAPYFIRIDHQFYDERLKLLDFKTHRDVKFSDHYPLTGTYTFQKDKEEK